MRTDRPLLVACLALAAACGETRSEAPAHLGGALPAEAAPRTRTLDGACAPRACAEVGAECGVFDDGCGGLLDCQCSAGACGAGGVANRCAPVAPFCPDGWCLEWPSTVPGLGLFSAPGAAAAWAVDGSSGALLRISPKGWRQIPAPADSYYDLYPVNDEVAWAVASGFRLSRFDGTRWESIEPPPYAVKVLGVAETAGGVVWVLGGQGDERSVWLYRNGGNRWTVELRLSGYPRFRTIGGEPWLTNGGTLQRVRPEADGSRPEIPLPPSAWSIRGSGPDDVWANDEKSIAHWDGTRWTDARTAPPGAIVGTRTEFFATRPPAMWDGERLRAVPLDSDFASLAQVDGTSRAYASESGGSLWELTAAGARRLAGRANANARTLRIDGLSVGRDGAVLLGTSDTYSSMHRFVGGRVEQFGDGKNFGLVWHTAADSIFAKEDDFDSALNFFDGVRWTETPLRYVSAVSSPARGVAWAVGGSGIFEYDAAHDVWRGHPELASSARAVLAFAADDVWISAGQLLLHRGAAGFSATQLVGARALGVIAGRPDDLWVADAAQVHHFDGKGWSAFPLPVTGTVSAMAAGATELHVLLLMPGKMRRQFRLAGGVWTEAPASTLHALAAAPDGSAVYGADTDALYRYAGDGRWVKIAASEMGFQFAALGGTADDDLWIAGAGIAHRTAGGWTEVENPGFGYIGGVAAVSPTEAWAITRFFRNDSGQVLRWDGQRWEVARGSPDAALNAISVAGDAGWIVGDRGTLLRYDPARHAFADFPPLTEDLLAVYTRDSSEAWAVGRANVYRFDGARWSPVAPATSLDVIFGAPTGPVWFGSSLNAVFRSSDAGWSTELVPPDPRGGTGFLAGVGLDSQHALAAGNGGVLERDENGWHREAHVPVGRPSAVWGRSPDSLFVGGRGVAHRVR